MKLLENKIIRLVEERGYAGTKYIPICKLIVNYIQNYINNNVKNVNDGWEFSIPSKITKKIDCVHDLIIDVLITDNINNKNNSGGGHCYIHPKNKIINNKLEFSHIKIFGYSQGTDLFCRTVFNSLSHEFNHIFETYKRMINKKDNALTIYQRAFNQEKINNTKFSDNIAIDSFIKMLFYRLMFKDEFNALINSVYGDLEGFNSNRCDFRTDIKRTQAYFIYYKIKENLNILNNLNDDTWIKIMMCYNILSVDGAKGYANIKEFKNRFKKHILYKLTNLIKGIGKISTYFYDVKEESNINEILIINSNPDTFISNIQ